MDRTGHVHPISSLIREANRIFYDLGFEFAEGPLIEDQWHNFDALNFPSDHPARDMQDTFFLKGGADVLRTHTSNVQIRYMESQVAKGVAPPYRMIAPGKVFRNEATDITHEAEFFQIEGLVVDSGTTVGHLKWTIEHFLRQLCEGSEVEVRFRPSFFPFVEPGVEVDMRVRGGGVPEKLRGRWVEMMGAGIVHPNVLKNAGVDPEAYQGFAFGMGLDRLAILRWGIDDIRLMHSADLRFTDQF